MLYFKFKFFILLNNTLSKIGEKIGEIMLYNNPFSHMTPFFPSEDGKTQDLAIEVIARSAALSDKIHPVTQTSIINHLRIINSYYSNRIEGNYTHPIDIEKAIKRQYSEDPTKRKLQIESQIHVEIQELINKKFKTEFDVFSLEFILILHKTFYENMPEELKTVYDDDHKESAEVVPGELRKREVKVGKHIPPNHTSISRLIDKFQSVYNPNKLHGPKKILAAACSHHRLLWIHPFLDGNGRIVRLFTDTFMSCVVKGYGLWTISRGFARNRDQYMEKLNLADSVRQGDYDGRGFLSQKGMDNFCIFFLELCIDQIDFMGSLLDIDGFLDRLNGYVSMRENKVIPGMTPLKKEAFYLLKEVFLCGTFNRGEAARLTGLPERTARDILKTLVQDELLLSDTPKGPVRLNIPSHAANYLFPDLFPHKPAA